MSKNKFFEGLKAGLEDAIAYQQGKLHLRSYEIEMPDSPAEDINKIRLVSGKKYMH